MQIFNAWDEAVDTADEINKRIRLEKRSLVITKKWRPTRERKISENSILINFNQVKVNIS